MSKIKVWDVHWLHTTSHVTCECVLGNVVIDKKTNIATIFGVTGSRKWYPSISKSLKNDEMRLHEIMNRINEYHKDRVKYVVGSWLKNEIQ